MGYYWHDDFETPAEGWFTVGGAGFDHGLGCARTGVGNARVRTRLSLAVWATPADSSVRLKDVEAAIIERFTLLLVALRYV